PSLPRSALRSGRAGGPPVPPLLGHGAPLGGAHTVAIARSALRAASGRMRPSCRARFHPETPQRARYNLPLLPLECELRPALFGDSVVLALAAAFGRSPLGRDKTVPLQPVQHRVEHAVGPLHMAPRQLRHTLDDCIAITLTFGQD